MVSAFDNFLQNDCRILDKLCAHRLEKILLIGDLFAFRSHDVTAQQVAAVQGVVALFEPASKFGNGFVNLLAAGGLRALLISKLETQYHVSSGYCPAHSGHLHTGGETRGNFQGGQLIHSQLLAELGQNGLGTAVSLKKTLNARRCFSHDGLILYGA